MNNKNIYLLPTDRPSRLSILNNGKLNFGAEIMSSSNSKTQHIYITNNEDPKDGDWVVAISAIKEKPHIAIVFKCGKHITGTCKKIILTTDQDLIEDGVQAITNTFAEWFVKNPNCEEVQINDWMSTNGTVAFGGDRYQICNHLHDKKTIIPQEEPKQELYIKEQKERRKKLFNVINQIEKEELTSKQKIFNYLQVCKECGSEEVARCKWVNVNTEEIYSADSGTTLEWCFNCKSETNIIDKEDYE